MIEVPFDTPVTVPVEPIVATPVFELDQTPPPLPLLKLVVAAAQTEEAPLVVFTVGVVAIVTAWVAVVPQPVVYEMVTLPFETPVTIPVEPTVAMPVELLLQVPPAVMLVSVVVAPVHKVELPAIVAGAAFIFTVVTAELVRVPLVLQVPVPVHVILQ